MIILRLLILLMRLHAMQMEVGLLSSFVNEVKKSHCHLFDFIKKYTKLYDPIFSK